MRWGLQLAPEDRKVLILSNSQAAITTVRKAGRTGRARTEKLKEVVEEVRKRQKPNAVRFAWVKAQSGLTAMKRLTRWPNPGQMRMRGWQR